MSQFIELKTNMGDTFIVLPNISHYQRPTNMSGYGGGGVGRFPVKLSLIGGQTYLMETSEFDRLGTAIDNAGISSILVPSATKETVVVVHNAIAINRYEDSSTSRTRIRGEANPVSRGVEITMMDGSTIKAEPRDLNTDLYEVFKSAIGNGNSEEVVENDDET